MKTPAPTSLRLGYARPPVLRWRGGDPFFHPACQSFLLPALSAAPLIWFALSRVPHGAPACHMARQPFYACLAAGLSGDLLLGPALPFDDPCGLLLRPLFPCLPFVVHTRVIWFL